MKFNLVETLSQLLSPAVVGLLRYDFMVQAAAEQSCGCEIARRQHHNSMSLSPQAQKGIARVGRSWQAKSI
jgi:hypothetical protein